MFAALIALGLSKPIDDSKDAQILKFENDSAQDGYKFA